MELSDLAKLDKDFWWRVTRFDPSGRNDRGFFDDPPWCSIYDIGQAFDGVVLDEATYLATENEYVNAVIAFARDAEVDRLEVRQYERGDGIKDGQSFTLDTVGEVVRRLLRGDGSWLLVSPDDQMLVSVGYDLYMYIGSNLPCQSAVEKVSESGLFVEEGFMSPWVDALLDET